MEPATEDSYSKCTEFHLKSSPSNKIMVLLDTGSNGDLYFHEKGMSKPFPCLMAGTIVLTYVKWDCPDTWMGQTQNQIPWLICNHRVLSTTWHCWVWWSQPGFEFIIGKNTLKELGIVLNFQTKEMNMDEIILPIRDIIKLSTRAKIERAWMANNSDIIY
jgi:hypothetical protein